MPRPPGELNRLAGIIICRAALPACQYCLSPGINSGPLTLAINPRRIQAAHRICRRSRLASGCVLPALGDAVACQHKGAKAPCSATSRPSASAGWPEFSTMNATHRRGTDVRRHVLGTECSDGHGAATLGEETRGDTPAGK